MSLLFVGLGNPGSKYKNNRHNLGFRMMDTLADVHASTSFKEVAHLVEMSFLNLGENRIILAKPLTFMNLSGRAVRFLMDFYKIALEKIYVFHDDIDLAFGSVKIKKGGGSGGHNGIRSIDSLIGKDYWRVRVGIGRPQEKSMVSSHVLGNFSEDEEGDLSDILMEISKNISPLLEGDFQLKTDKL
jgi:PTH1 family peptidyl-tRNA hydrolase